MSYPYDQVLSRDRGSRQKGRDLGPSCLMRFLPKIGHIKFEKKNFSLTEESPNKSNLKQEFKIGNLGDVIKPKVFDDPKYKMKKIVSHEELLEALEIIVQDKVFNKSLDKCLIFLGTSKEPFFNIFKAFCGFEHERIFSKLDDVDIEREKEKTIRRKRRAKEKRLQTKKSKGLLTENEYEEELRKVYLQTHKMKQELEEEYENKNREFISQYKSIDNHTENLLLVFDCFSNLCDYYGGVNISSESTLRRIVDYVDRNNLSNTKIVVFGVHSNKFSSSEQSFYKKTNKVDLIRLVIRKMFVSI